MEGNRVEKKNGEQISVLQGIFHHYVRLAAIPEVRVFYGGFHSRGKAIEIVL